MDINNLKKWLKGEYVSPPEFKESLEIFIKEYEELKETSQNYRAMCQSFVGQTIRNFFCNGFFGSRTYDLSGAEITRVYESDDDIIIEVKKINGRYEYGYFDDGWNDWKTVYDHLGEWTSENEEG